MVKIKPERVAGIVALSYLVLIPAGGLYGYLKIRQLDQDVNSLWDGLDPVDRPERDAPSPADVINASLRRVAQRVNSR